MTARLSTFVLVCLVLGAAWPSSAASDKILLQDQFGDSAPVIELLNQSPEALTLKLSLPFLNQEEVVSGDRTFQRLSLPDGGFLGATDQPARPSLTRLVLLPEGSAVQVNLLSKQEKSLGQLWLAPVQPVTENGVKAPAYNSQLYSQTPATQANVLVGKPSLMHGLRVVPITFSPVGFDPNTGEATAALEMVVEVKFEGSNFENNSRGSVAFLPESFATLYEETVLGWTRGEETQVGPGSMIYVCPDISTVTEMVEDLAQWRRQQGYNVEVVTTATTGTNNTSIRNWLMARYAVMDPPLEFVTMVGDANGSISTPTFYESTSGYGGEGDHNYSRLDGDDVLADVHVGRLTVRSTSELRTVVDKILNYEKYPDMSDTSWFTTAGLTGDPATSGQSCIYTNQFFKQELLELNYTQVDTIWGGNFVSLMSNTINQGETFFTYRGLGGMSGMQAVHIGYLTNGGKLPFAIILTCDTGSFSDDSNSRSEAFLRASNGGGIASIGTATNGTHTRYNNCMFLGITEHVTNSGDFRVGPALTRGKLNFYLNFWETEENKVWTWSTWNNLMGDPATELWTGIPKMLTVEHPAQVSHSAGAMPVTVMNHGRAVAGARVALYQTGTVRSVGFTDDAGRVVLDLSGAVNGDVQVTVTGHNLHAHQSVTAVGVVDQSLEFQSLALENGIIQPGQSAPMSVEIANSGTNLVPGVEAAFVSPYEWLSMEAGSVVFGDIAPGAAAWGNDDFNITLSDVAPGGAIAQLEMLSTSGDKSWSSLVSIAVTGPRADKPAVLWSNGELSPGESSSLDLPFVNIGNQNGAGAVGVLSCDSAWIDITTSQATWASAAVGATASPLSSFEVSAESACFPGYLANFSLELTFAEGGRQVIEFQQAVGTPGAGDPAGPDSYGYFALDNEDNSPLAPEYQWVDLDLLGGGNNLGFSDNGRYGDETKVVDLPFPFTFYGQEYEEISVCSNGWLSFGVSDLKFYRNWHLPAAGSPSAMVAAFWDDLAEGQIFSQYDADNHQFIIQWSNFKTYQGSPDFDYYNGDCTFQIILLDPAYYPSETGDGILVLQYESVTIYADESTVFTAGIQNHNRDQGLTYTYGNMYAGGAAPIESGRAISFRTVRPRPQGSMAGAVLNESFGLNPVPSAQVTLLGSGYFLTTDQNGNYSGNVPAGTWDVEFAHLGCEADTVANVVVLVDQTTQLDFNLVDNAGPAFSGVTQLASTSDTSGPYLVEATIEDISGVASAHFYYTSSESGGPFELSLVPAGGENQFQVSLPGQPLGSLVQYWLTAEDNLSQSSAMPEGAPWPVFSFQVAANGTFLTEEFENANNWVVNADGQDDATNGLWVWGDPIATSYNGSPVQPGDDHTPLAGVNCWFTGQHQNGESAGYGDVDGGATSLTSPTYDLTGQADVTLSYWRWYTNNTGSSPDQDYWVVEISNDNGSSWVEVENTATSNANWQQTVVHWSDHFATPGLMKLKFTASDEGSGSLVEAAIDDVTISATNTIPDQEDPAVVIVAPNGGETVSTGQPLDITWQGSDDTGIVQAQLSLSLDGGNTFGDPILTGAFNGVCQWTVLVPESPTSTARFMVEVFDALGNSSTDISDGDFTIQGQISGSSIPGPLLAMSQNHPNPFNPQTEIVFWLPKTEAASLQVYDIQGRLVRTLIQEELPAGMNRITWKGKNESGGAVSSGTYFYRLNTESGTLVRKMTLLK